MDLSKISPMMGGKSTPPIITIIFEKATAVALTLDLERSLLTAKINISAPAKKANKNNKGYIHQTEGVGRKTTNAIKPAETKEPMMSGIRRLWIQSEKSPHSGPPTAKPKNTMEEPKAASCFVMPT